MSLITRDKSRDIRFTPNINPYSNGSVIAEFGNTKVHITVSIENTIPSWLKGSKQGWLSSEYSMLPMSTHTRTKRDRSKVSGRTQEIQRLIGRSLRSIIDLKKLGEKTITIDCDVLVADGGTRTTAISGAYIALVLAIDNMLKEGIIKENPIIGQIAAISVGINSKGEIISDLNYQEDSNCCTDMNIVMNKNGEIIEIQGTAERGSFTTKQLETMITCCKSAIQEVFKKQDDIIG